MRLGPVAPASRWNPDRVSEAVADLVAQEAHQAQADRWPAKKPSTFSQPSIAASGRYIGVW
jgi:hypothetical protein